MRKVESVNLQLLELLLGLLLETRRAGRSGGEHPFDEDARHHAEGEIINPDERHAIHELIAFPRPYFFFLRALRGTRLQTVFRDLRGKKKGRGRRRSATHPNDSPTGVELDLT